MKTFWYFTALALLSIGLFLFALSAYAQAGGPWSDQYCDIKTEKIITKSVNGEIIDEKIIEKVTCEDGVKDFLHGSGIASSCKYFNWYMPVGNQMVKQRSIVCKRLDGGHEIVQGYHSTD